MGGKAWPEVADGEDAQNAWGELDGGADPGVEAQQIHGHLEHSLTEPSFRPARGGIATQCCIQHTVWISTR